MTTFLHDVARIFRDQYGDEISRFAFVFPNRRAGVFFQRELAQMTDKPLFSPAILTINELFLRQSELQVADKVSMLFLLYKIYKEISGSEETFDEFVFWGDMLLNDFDDVDKWLAHPGQLFMNIKDLREIDDTFDYLSEDQIDAIRQFWSSFSPHSEGQKVTEFLALWKVLLPVYEELREQLMAEGLAYEGMIFREVAERAKRKDLQDFPYEQIIFVGFNAISATEKALMTYLRDNGTGDFYWDFDSVYLEEKENKASMFIGYSQLFPSKLDVPKQASTNPRFELVDIASRIGQAKELSSILSAWLPDGTQKNTQEALQTAVILPDEEMLLPVLYSIPENIESINVTMGYSLSTSPVAGLFEQIIALQSNWSMSDGEPTFYYRFVRPILLHRYVRAIAPEAESIDKNIRDHNLIFVPESQFKGSVFLKKLFKPLRTGEDISSYLLDLLDSIVEVRQEEGDASNISDIEREFIYHYYIALVRFRDLLREEETMMSMDTYFRLLRKLIGGVNVSFQGEPLSGLQVMGVLETRALDFDRMVILSMNEGVFPLRKAANSFIPASLRRAFGLPTTEHQDGIYAYHFYRMLHRASEVVMIYDSRTDGLQTGEVSRFIYQLEYLYGKTIHRRSVKYNIAIDRQESIAIAKNDMILQKLNRFLAGGTKAFSASSINTYLECPLRFYYSYVEGLREQDNLSEHIEANTFGDLFHYMMEQIYNELKARNEVITKDVLSAYAKNQSRLTELIQKSFAVKVFDNKNYRKALEGQNYLVGEIIRKYVIAMLKQDMSTAPFKYIASEMKVEGTIKIGSDREVRLTGSIDRVDQLGKYTRLIDYKSGKTKAMSFKQISELFDPVLKNRPQYVLQVFFYSMIYQELFHDAYIQPGVVFIRTLFDKNKYETRVSFKNGKVLEPLDEVGEWKDEFKRELQVLLEEIFDPSVSFTQTQDLARCEYCDFTSLCRRK
ncbi:MAG: PD-(D/E)XK nuclease family protein [Bacteroidales bacterium]